MKTTHATSLTALARRLALGLPLLAAALWTSPAQAQNYLYYTESTQPNIGRADLSGTAPLTPTGNFITTGSQPWGIAVDATNVYWANSGGASLGIATLAGDSDTTTPPNNQWIDTTGGLFGDGTAVFGSSFPTAIAIDANNIYWADAVNNCICKAAINDPTHPTIPWITLTPGAAPEGLAVDGTSIYWTEQAGPGGTGTIGKVLLTYPTVGTISETLVSGLSDPTGMVVNSQYIFWVDNTLSTINQVDLNGGATSNSNFPYTSLIDSNLISLTVGTSLYWGGDDLGLLSLDGSSVTDPFVTSSTGPYYGVTITNAPTVITLASFGAQGQASQVTLSWTTGSEVDTAGFNVWRSGSYSGTFTKINPTLIAAQGTGVSGASYTWTDAQVAAGQTYYYKLEDLDTHGVSTFHGPTSAVVGTPSPLVSFGATPADLFLGGGTFLTWNVTGSPALTVNGKAVSGTSLWVAPTATTAYTLADAQGDQRVVTVGVKTFSLLDLPGLSLAWGSVKGDAHYNPAYDLNGDGKVDDADVALCFASH